MSFSSKAAAISIASLISIISMISLISDSVYSVLNLCKSFSGQYLFSTKLMKNLLDSRIEHLRSMSRMAC